MIFKGNDKYKEVCKSGDVSFYVPVNANDYHLSRFMAANAQNVYSASGATKEYLTILTDKLIQMANDEKSIKTLRTDIGTLANNLKYRLRYPVDEDCAIRMGAIYCFMEGENPDTCEANWTEQKLKLAKSDPDLYAFFLITGIEYTPSWRELESVSIDTDYLNKRREALNGLTL